MKNNNPSLRDEWRTPFWLFKYARLLHALNRDAACNKKNALLPPVAPRYGDALTVEWSGRIWCNPPYSNISPWIDKAFESGAYVVMLIPSPNGEERYRRLMEDAFEISIVGRVGFINAAGKEVKGNPRGSSLFIIGDTSPGEGRRICVDRETIRNWNYRSSGHE
jgi:phage N-6-adenine-methyltransferase